MDPKQAQKYFKPLSLKPGLVLIGVGAVVLLAGFGGGAVGAGFIGFLIAAAGVGWLYLQINGRPSDADMDAAINQLGAKAKNAGLQRLGLDPDEVTLIEPVIIEGPDFRNSKGQVKRGKDKVLRSAANEVVVLFFSENEVHTYRISESLTDTSFRREQTDEYFYRDVVSVTTATDVEKVVIDGVSQEVQLETFRLTTSGGTSVSCATYDAGGVANSIQGMRALIKQKKLV